MLPIFQFQKNLRAALESSAAIKSDPDATAREKTLAETIELLGDAMKTEIGKIQESIHSRRG
jgi:hypothetical protein